MTYTTIPAILGPVVGPLLGGIFTTYTSWRWIFFVNIPFGVAGILLALRFVEDTRSDTKTPFDVPGFLLVGAGIALIQFGTEAVGRPFVPAGAVAALLAVAGVLLFAYGVYARRVPPWTSACSGSAPSRSARWPEACAVSASTARPSCCR